MTRLLSTDCFDAFLLNEATVKMSVTWTVDGNLNRAFYPKELRDDPSALPYKFEEWKNIRLRVRDLIKGRQAPVSFQIVLQLKPQFMNAVFAQAGEQVLLTTVSALILTVRMDENGIVILSGISKSSFTPERNADILWDKTVCRFLDEKEIAYQTLT